MGTFVVLMKASSGATFGKRERLQINYGDHPGALTLTFSTRRADLGLGVETSIELLVEARGEAGSLDEATESFSVMANIACAVIATASNAAVAPVKIVAAYEVTALGVAGDYFQRYMPDPPPALLQNRRVDVALLQAIFPAFGAHEKRERLVRAVDHYRISLLNSLPGQDLLAFNPLWICVEALTPPLLERELKRTDLDRDGLYQAFGLPASEFPGVRNRNLDGAVRERFIFHGDHACYQDAKKASDGYEHAFMDGEQLRELVRRAKEPTGRHVRRAIFELLNLDPSVVEALSNGRFARPLQRWEYDLAIRAKLTPATDGSIAPLDGPHPRFRWDHPIQSMHVNPDETYTAQLGGNLIADLAEGARFDPIRMEIRGPEREPLNHESGERFIDGTVPAKSDDKPIDDESKNLRLNRLRLIGLMDRILNAAERIAPLKPFETTPADFKAFEMFWRARSLFDGIRALVKDQLSDEAWILAGRVFEEALRIGQLRTAGQARNALALGWIDVSLESQRQLAIIMAARHGGDPSEMLKAIDGRRESLIAQSKERGVDRFESFLPAKEAATLLGRDEDFWLYEMAQDFARGSHFTEVSRVKKTGDVVEMFSKTGDIGMAGAVVEFAGKALLLATIDMAEMFGRGDVGQCKALIAEMDAMEPPERPAKTQTATETPAP